ncbi:MAG TPA: chorismate-binding protein, partial [Flavisolibacter sp.]|nr:chorismate-binding protein [Flavisolibacter sp.]
MLNWASRFGIFCFLDNQEYYSQSNQYELLLAVEVEKEFIGDSIDKLDLFIQQDKNWCFGHLSYDLKNAFYSLPQSRPNQVSFPPVYFFKPRTLIAIKGNEITITSDDPDIVWNEIVSTKEIDSYSANEIKIQQRISKEEYIEIIKNLKWHISRGDCYEINFCQEFYATIERLNPYYVFQKLMEVSPNPFSAFYKLNDKFLLCASPERYL